MEVPMKKMRVKIGLDGKTTIQVEGAVGPECVEFTRLFEAALGEVEKRVFSEAYEEEQTEKETINIYNTEIL
jgi:hypothetical protein